MCIRDSLQVAARLMGAPLGEVESRPIGSMKSTIVDRIEDRCV